MPSLMASSTLSSKLARASDCTSRVASCSRHAGRVAGEARQVAHACRKRTSGGRRPTAPAPNNNSSSSSPLRTCSPTGARFGLGVATIQLGMGSPSSVLTPEWEAQAGAAAAASAAVAWLLGSMAAVLAAAASAL